LEKDFHLGALSSFDHVFSFWCVFTNHFWWLEILKHAIVNVVFFIYAIFLKPLAQMFCVVTSVVCVCVCVCVWMLLWAWILVCYKWVTVSVTKSHLVLFLCKNSFHVYGVLLGVPCDMVVVWVVLQLVELQLGHFLV